MEHSSVDTAPYLAVQGLCKQYPKQAHPAVDDLSFTLESGRLLALLGPNGAGKTTTIKMIAGLVLPSSGEVRVLGQDVVQQRQAAVRHIGAVLEGARNLYWRLSAWENLLYFGAVRLVPPTVLRQQAQELLHLVGLHDDKDREVRHFSRGMQQKLAIAAALLHDPDLLLLDEPTLGLDVEAARVVEKTVINLARERGKAIVLTTHQMDLAERVADEIFVIHRGRQVAYAETNQLLQEYNLHRQTVQVSLCAPLAPQQLADLQQTYPALSISGNGRFPSLTCTVDEQATLVQLLAHLDRAGIGIETVSYQRARLEDVFVSLTTGAQP